MSAVMILWARTMPALYGYMDKRVMTWVKLNASDIVRLGCYTNNSCNF